MGLPSKGLSADDLKDDKILTKIVTEAGGLELDEVKKTLFKVKAGDLAKESVENLKGAKVEELQRTYAYLTNKEEKDEEVTKFKVEGLKAMIIYRLRQLMPVGCPKCNVVYVNDRLDVPQVTCRGCGIGACPDCFTSEEKMNKWTFLCRSCDEAVVCMKGEESLAENKLKKEKKKKDGKKKNTEAYDAIEVVVEVEDHDGGEDIDGEEEELELEERVSEGAGDTASKNVAKPARSRNENMGSTEKENDNEAEKKKPICYHFKKGRCRHGLSGKKKVNGVEMCPFRHPRICGKLLRHGDRGRGGCRGAQDGCKEFHDVKMCFSSMNTRKCAQKECKNGFHIKGTVIEQKEDKDGENGGRVETQKAEKVKPWAQTNNGGSEKANDNNVASFLGQMLLQQQEMMQQIQQQAQQQNTEQMQFQQHMLQMIARMNGATESRPVSTTVQQPLNYRQVV